MTVKEPRFAGFNSSMASWCLAKHLPDLTQTLRRNITEKLEGFFTQQL